MNSLKLGQQAILRQFYRSQAPRRCQQLLLYSRTHHLQPSFHTRPQSLFQNRAFHNFQKRPVHRPRIQTRTRRCESTDAQLDKPDSQLTLGQRMKKLSREYGWAALYIYLGLSALDFPFCFLAVKLIGTDTIGHWEHVIVTNLKQWLQWPLGTDLSTKVDEVVDKVEGAVGASSSQDGAGTRVLEADETYVIQDHGYKEAEEANKGDNASLWTQLALAYAIHKSFIFVRVPLTAAVTPKIVKTLRGWGWNIGRPTRKALSPNKSGVNTKGSKVKPDD